MRLRSIVCVLLLLPTCIAHAGSSQHSVCGDQPFYDRAVFELDIQRSFTQPVTFTLCERKDPRQNFLLVTSETNGRPVRKTDRRITLDEHTYSKMVALYEDALNFNVKDDVGGTDGSTWCLETKRHFSYLKACFYTPGEDTKDRGLSGLSALGTELWHLAGMEPIVGKLF